MNKFDFVEFLRKQMREHGWNMTELAEHTGLSRQAITLYMSGKRFPMLYSFIQILDSLGKHIRIEDN